MEPPEQTVEQFPVPEDAAAAEGSTASHRSNPDSPRGTLEAKCSVAENAVAAGAAISEIGSSFSPPPSTMEAGLLQILNAFPKPPTDAPSARGEVKAEDPDRKTAPPDSKLTPRLPRR